MDDLVNKFEQTDYFQYLVKNAKELEQERMDFNENMDALINSQTEELGLVLKCHLILENYLDEYLKSAYPTIREWDQARLSFYQKMQLVNSEKSVLQRYIPAIKSLNSLRNKFAHKIQYKITPEDYKEMSIIINTWYSALGKPPVENIKIIGLFTIWACAEMNQVINGINKHSKTGLVGYMEWIKKMTESK